MSLCSRIWRISLEDRLSDIGTLKYHWPSRNYESTLPAKAEHQESIILWWYRKNTDNKSCNVQYRYRPHHSYLLFWRLIQNFKKLDTNPKLKETRHESEDGIYLEEEELTRVPPPQQESWTVAWVSEIAFPPLAANFSLVASCECQYLATEWNRTRTQQNVFALGLVLSLLRFKFLVL